MSLRAIQRRTSTCTDGLNINTTVYGRSKTSIVSVLAAG
jgi:hypothetical protein